MAKPLTVWGGCIDGTNRLIVAAPSKKAACALLGVSLYRLNTYFCDTENDEEIRISTAAPGTVFIRPDCNRDDATWAPLPVQKPSSSKTEETQP